MEHVASTPILFLLLLSGVIIYTDHTATSQSTVLSWPPRTAQDLVLFIQGANPHCYRNISTTAERWRKPLESLSSLMLTRDPQLWLNEALNLLVNVSSTQGDLKHLLLWGISHNLSWGFLDLPLVRPLSEKSQVLNVSLKTNISKFLVTCSERLLPALKRTCRFISVSMSASLQSLCSQLTSTSQTLQMDKELCRYIFTQLSDLTDPCSTSTVRTVRSATSNCNYLAWYTSEASPSDVSTCSENDKQAFISSVCGDQKLLNKLITWTENNWLQGFCAFNTNPENMCHYVSWDGNTISDFSVAYCWLYDQEQFLLYLCANPNLLNQLKANPNNQWLDPVCPTEPPTDAATPSMIQLLCNYDQWQLENIDPSIVAFCAYNDKIALSNYVCLSLGVSQQLFIFTSNPWIAELCVNLPTGNTENNCDYSTWLKKDMDNQSVLAVPSSVVSNCSQIAENGFLSSVCRNSSLLTTMTKDTNNSWVVQFCTQHLCNYTAWNSSVFNTSLVDLCRQFDQKQLELYLCSNQNITQWINVNISSNLTCNRNNTHPTLCSYNLSSLTTLNSSLLATCAAQDASNFSHFICENFTLVIQLSNVPENSWIPMFCNGKLNYSISNCTDYISNYLSSSCQNCNKTGQKLLILSICTQQNLIQVLDVLGNATVLNTFIVQHFCNYSSWELVDPTAFLVSYCWSFDSLTFSQVVCNHFNLYGKLSEYMSNSKIFPQCHMAEICQYSTWNLTSLQDSLVQYCFHWDTQNFTQFICTNSSVNILLNESNYLSLVGSYCGNSSQLHDGPNHCAYMDWNPSSDGWKGPVDYSTLYLCSQNDTLNFTGTVCNNSGILRAISEHSALKWTMSFCYNRTSVTVLSQILIMNVCDYSSVLSPILVKFCWYYDQDTFSYYLCTNSSFYAFIKSEAQNFWLNPACIPPTAIFPNGTTNFSLLQCHYEQSPLTNMDISLIKFCAEHNQETFLNTIFNNGTKCQEGNSSCLSAGNLCSYHSWDGEYIPPAIVKLCWAIDQLNFNANVCNNASSFPELLHDSANSWLRPLCGSNSRDQMEPLVSMVCSYNEWGTVNPVPGMIVALCETYDQENFLQFTRNNQTAYNYNETLRPWWGQYPNCDYGNWENLPLDSYNIFLCWVLERDVFPANVCSRPKLLAKMGNDSATSWVVKICSVSNTPNESVSCLSDNDKNTLHWNCSADLSSVCLGEGLTFLSFLPLSSCYLQSTGFTPTANFTERYIQAVDATVILLLLLEEIEVLSLSGSYMVRAKAWNSALNFISQEKLYSDQRRELILKFGNTLLLLAGEQITSNQSWILIEEFFNLTLPDLKVVISSLQPAAVKMFLSILQQNLTSLQAPEDYFTIIVTTLLTVQVPLFPFLLGDIVPFLSFLEPDQIIRLLPPLQDDKEVLQVMSLYGESLSKEQRFALGFWLRRTTILTDISQLDDLFLRRVGNLLPLLPLDVFKQLSSQQAVNILPFIPKDLSPPYQRVLASRVLQVANITMQDIKLLERVYIGVGSKLCHNGFFTEVLDLEQMDAVMGSCVCQADIQDLKYYQQNMDLFMELRKLLFQCVRTGELFPDSQMLDFLTTDLHWQNPKTLSSQTISNLSPVIPALGYTFLQTLITEQFLSALSDIGLARLTPVQARLLVQKILNSGNISDEVLSTMGSLVLGLSPTFLQQLSANQLMLLLPALSKYSSSLSYAQTLSAIKTLWASWNLTNGLQDLGPLLSSLPLKDLSTRSKELLSNMNSVIGVKWNQQQALFLFQIAVQTTQNGARSSGDSVTGNNCNLLKNILQDDLQNMTQLYDIINALPRQLIHCALNKITTLPPALSLLNYLSSQNLPEIHPSVVSLLPQKTCRILLKALKSEAQFVAELPQQRRFALLNALVQCLSSAGPMSTTEILVALGVLTPFLQGQSYLALYRGIMKQNVESVTSYCYPQETRLLLAQLLQEPRGFRSSKQWGSPLLERLDRLALLLPVSTLQSLNTAALFNQLVIEILSEENKWRNTPLGTACRQTESAAESLDSMQRQRTFLKRSFLARSASAPECGILHDSIVSAWGVDLLLGMTPPDFMDCLEVIGRDPDIPTTELALLLGRVLEIAGPPSNLTSLVLIRLGRLATQFSEPQLQEIFMKDWQVIEAFGNQKEWTLNQMNILASRYMNSNNLSAQALDSLQLSTLGYVICGLSEGEMTQIKPSEFCSAIMYLGQLALQCTEKQLYALTRLCANSGMFGPVSGWTQEVFLEIGSVAAGLDDMEVSSLVLEQIQGLTPLAVSLIHPTKFAVAFSAQQLQMFSWSQAKAVTDQQRKLLDTEQLKALTIALTEDSGTYKAGKSHADHCTVCTLLYLCVLIPALHVYNLLRPITVLADTSSGVKRYPSEISSNKCPFAV